MPLYYFNLYNQIGFVPDEEGRELPDLDAARAEALNGVRSVLAEDVLAGRLDLDGRLEILDSDGAPVLTVTFAEAVEICPPLQAS